MVLPDYFFLTNLTLSVKLCDGKRKFQLTKFFCLAKCFFLQCIYKCIQHITHNFSEIQGRKFSRIIIIIIFTVNYIVKCYYTCNYNSELSCVDKGRSCFQKCGPYMDTICSINLLSTASLQTIQVDLNFTSSGTVALTNVLGHSHQFPQGCFDIPISTF